MSKIEGCALKRLQNYFLENRSFSLSRFELVNKNVAYLLVTLVIFDFSLHDFLIFLSSIRDMLLAFFITSDISGRGSPDRSLNGATFLNRGGISCLILFFYFYYYIND